MEDGYQQTQTRASRLPAGGRKDVEEKIQMTQYQVLLNTAGPLEIAAAKVNLGVTKLWFYDDEDHLLAVFRWDQVIGLQVVGSAKEQAFTHDLLHAKKTQADELAERERKNGMFLTTAELFRDCGLKEGEEIREWRGFTVEPITFDE